jgi:hypothetical protein
MTMSRLALFGIASLVLAALTAGVATADDRPRTERRLAELERQLEAALKEVKNLRAGSPAKAEAAPKDDFGVYRLKNASAADLAQALQALLGDEDKKIRIVAEPVSNTLLVRATPDQTALFRALIQQLDVPAEGGAAKPKDAPKEAPKEAGSLTEKLEKVVARLALVESDLAQLQDRAAWSDRMAKKQFISAAQAQAERARLKEAEDARAKLLDELASLATRAKPKP